MQLNQFLPESPQGGQAHSGCTVKYNAIHLEMLLLEICNVYPSKPFLVGEPSIFFFSLTMGHDGFKDFVLPSDFRHRNTHLPANPAPTVPVSALRKKS